MALKPELVASVKSVREIAIFTDELFHKLEDNDLVQGSDIVKLASKHGLNIPPMLEDFSMKYNAKPHILSQTDLDNTIVVVLPPRPATLAAKKKKASKGGCVDFDKGPIKGTACVNCSFSWTSVSCEITITITLGI
jgi:hypothetical protein